ncbi:putative ribonuclease H-like domain-containing protein [Tanacetum coccineum]
MYSFDMKTPSPAKGFACLIAKATSDESKLWHRRLGHINFKNLNKLVKGNLVRGLPSKVFKYDHTCVACQKGKQHRASCKAKLERLITKPLHTLHMDLFGPTSVKSINHASYCLVITDDCTRFVGISEETTVHAVKISEEKDVSRKHPINSNPERPLTEPPKRLKDPLLIQRFQLLEEELGSICLKHDHDDSLSAQARNLSQRPETRNFLMRHLNDERCDNYFTNSLPTEIERKPKKIADALQDDQLGSNHARKRYKSSYNMYGVLGDLPHGMKVMSPKSNKSSRNKGGISYLKTSMELDNQEIDLVNVKAAITPMEDQNCLLTKMRSF